MRKTEAHKALNKAIGFLYRNQTWSGRFRSYASPVQSMQEQCVPDITVFPTACILYSLQFVDGWRARRIRKKGLNFLIREKNSPGIWRYCADRAPMRLDPDLDVTCCCSFLLRGHCRDIGSGLNTERILRNRNAQGLFLTWLRGHNVPNDVDSVVNANTILYLGDRPETADACDYLNHIVNLGQEAGSYHYYLDDLSLYYMMSRAYFNGVRRLEESREAIERKSLARLTNLEKPGNSLVTALGICTLLNCAFRGTQILDELIHGLLDQQERDGGRPLIPFYAGPEPPAPHAVWFGSRELTTALCAEALSRYLKLRDPNGDEDRG